MIDPVAVWGFGIMFVILVIGSIYESIKER